MDREKAVELKVKLAAGNPGTASTWGRPQDTPERAVAPKSGANGSLSAVRPSEIRR